MMFPTIVINREDPASMDAQTLLDELSATLAVFTGDSGQNRFSIRDVTLECSRFLVARSDSATPLGCGAFRPLGAQPRRPQDEGRVLSAGLQEHAVP